MVERRTRRVIFTLLLLASTNGCGARTAVDVQRVPFTDAGIRDAGFDARVARDVGPRDTEADAPDSTDARDTGDAITVVDAFISDAGDPCEIGPDPLREPVCTRALFGEPPSLSCPGGFVDVAAQGEGMLAWECMGVRAEARFGARVYRGQRISDVVALCIRTEFDYADGCHWQTSQRIEGDASGDALALSYREVATSGDGSCFPPCTADSIVDLR